MKKLWVAFAIAMAALMIFASPAFASGGNANANVDCSDIDVTDDSPAVGTTITFSGTVTIVSTAENNKNYGLCSGATAYAESNAWYIIYDPEGVKVAWGDSYKDDESVAWWFFNTSADASQTYNWSQDVYLDMVGDYVAEHGGEADAYYGHWETHWVQTGCRWWQGHWETAYFVEGSASASCSVERTVTSRSAVVAAASYSRPYLVIELPDGSRHFFSKDGWGDPTTEDIVYTDGTWQVEISDGTVIQLDGEWHRTTYLDVDSEGNVTGKYNAGGSTTAEDIGLSQPITITKVG